MYVRVCEPLSTLGTLVSDMLASAAVTSPNGSQLIRNVCRLYQASVQDILDVLLQVVRQFEQSCY